MESNYIQSSLQASKKNFESKDKEKNENKKKDKKQKNQRKKIKSMENKFKSAHKKKVIFFLEGKSSSSLQKLCMKKGPAPELCPRPRAALIRPSLPPTYMVGGGGFYPLLFMERAHV